MAEHYYTVGKHGAPTPETAPHGYKWRLDGPWICSGGPYEWHPENQWWPLPAPPTEQAPPPEPVKLWTVREIMPGRAFIRTDGMDRRATPQVPWGGAVTADRKMVEFTIGKSDHLGGDR